MKKTFILMLICLLSLNALISQNNFYSLSSSNTSSILCIASDNNGNQYISGIFSGNMVLGSKKMTASPSGNFLAKIDQSNQVLWAKQNTFWIKDMKFRKNKLYILGQYSKKLSIDGVEKTSASDNFFFACLDDNGKLEWLADGQSNGAVYADQFDFDEDGNCYVLCSFKEPVKLEDKQLNLGGDKNAFLAKYNQQGKLQWLKHLTGGNSYITGIWEHTLCYDAKGKQILVGGEFAGNCAFDAIKIKTRKLTFGPKEILDGNELFIAKYTTDGVCTSVKSYATEANLNQIRTDVEGNIYLGGYFKGDVSATKAGDLTGISIFGGNQKIKTTSDKDMSPTEDGYIAKFNSQDQFQWIARCNGKSTDRITGFTMDESGNIYAFGSAQVEVGFSGKTKTIQIKPIKGLGEELYRGDIFIAKINNSGDPEWFKMAGGRGNDDAKAISLSGNSVKVAGFMTGNIMFDNQSYTIDGNYFNGVVLSVPK